MIPWATLIWAVIGLAVMYGLTTFQLGIKRRYRRRHPPRR